MDNLLRIMLCAVVILVGITRIIDPKKARWFDLSRKAEESNVEEPTEFYYRCVRFFAIVMVVVMAALIVLILLGII